MSILEFSTIVASVSVAGVKGDMACRFHSAADAGR